MPPHFPLIPKSPIDEFPVRPNLDYRRDRESFDLQSLIDELDWLPGGRLNAAHEAIDRHAENHATKDKTAMVWEGKYGEREDYTFAQLKLESDKFANVLRSLGIGKGDHVFIMLERVPELYFAFFGILKVGGIAGPLPYATDPQRVKTAMQDVDTKVLVTQPDMRRMITPIIPELFELQHILVLNKDGRDPTPLDYQDLGYEEEMSKATSRSEIVPTAQDDPAVIHYRFDDSEVATGIAQEHGAVIRHYATGKWCLDLHPDDVYWSTADPGSPVGTFDGILAPWTNGVTQLIHEGRLTAAEWYCLVQTHGVTVASLTPETVHMLMEAGNDLPGEYDLSSLRFLASGGGPLEPEVVVWASDVLGRPVHDSWGQVEVGGIVCSNYASMEILPGSIGWPVPGVHMAVLDEEFKPMGPGVTGRIAIRPSWPRTPPDFPRDDSPYKRGWYVTGDRGCVEEDGCYWLTEYVE